MGNARIKRDGGKQGNGGARDAAPKVVLVGTYRGDQLVRWRGWYCWPMAADAAMQNAECRLQNDGLAQINELWLFRGTAEQKTYKAEFVGVKTREELIRDYGYKAKSQNKLTCVEICAGAGGQAIGLDLAGFEHVALVALAT